MSDLRPGTTMYRVDELERVARELRQDVRELRGQLDIANDRIEALEGRRRRRGRRGMRRTWPRPTSRSLAMTAIRRSAPIGTGPAVNARTAQTMSRSRPNTIPARRLTTTAGCPSTATCCPRLRLNTRPGYDRHRLPAPPGRPRLRPRQALAAAVLADYRRDLLDGLESGHAPDWTPHAHRLGTALGGLLAALDKPAAATDEDAGKLDGPLAPRQLEILGQALADAIDYRDPVGYCPDCETHPASLCEDHGLDLDRTDAYISLAHDLGIEVTDQ